MARPRDARIRCRSEPAGMTDAISPQLRYADGLHVRYAETQPVDGSTVLLLNPWPESLYAWEALWPRLSERARLVAIDLPGFGKSEARDDLYSPRAMGQFLITLIDEWQLGRPHVFGPDVGTGATLFAAAQEPDALTSAVVGSGGSAFPLEVTGPLKEMIESPDLEALRAVDGRDAVANTLTLLENYEPSDTARQDYLDSYAGTRFAESARYVRSYPTDLATLHGLLPEIRTPIQIIAGARDSLVPPANAEYLVDRVPNSQLALLDTGHFAWEDGAEEWGSIALDWIQGGYRLATGVRGE
ncbi:MAG TPA: alpha/beta hydrolase [Thermoleophilaceae bacterium]|jgi:pimeloyl-ACP methyl ester carboxylesterase|nr:alpha/beta hydrolase [Thermoleophilaceae bacterium]